MRTMMMIAMSALGSAALPAAAGAATVTVDLSGIKAGTGDLYVSLQRADQFMKNDGAYGEIVARPAAGARTMVLKDVAPGTYAANVWHDVDGDRQFDVGLDGGVADGWSTLNAETLRAKPTFEQVSFTVAGDEARTLKLAMRYGYGR